MRLGLAKFPNHPRTWATSRAIKLSIEASAIEKCHKFGRLPRKFQSYPLGEASRKIMLKLRYL